MAFQFGVFFCVLALLICFNVNSVDSDDGATLLEIKKSFRDVDNVLYDWTDSPTSDYCAWRGVSCDNVTFNVVALNLSGLNLDGEISPAIGNLESLVSIDLKENRLSGQIPDEIGDCSSLNSLDLSFNEIRGDIPFSISKLKQLESLILKNNQLIGPIPSTLSQIPNLKILDLAQNNLSGEIPRLIYWNEVLQYLGLRGNNLAGSLSPDMCQLTGLWYFDVRNNSLTGSIPENIGNCTSFQVLDLSYNQLTGEIPFNIGFLQIATLSLQGNKLSGHIPPVLGLMQALAVLDLSCNMLTGSIPPILGNLTYTEKLYLHGNKLTGSIPPELGNMTKLHYLELNDNLLSGRIPPELGKLTDLFDLNVANNNLEGPIPGNLSSCTNLNSLNVHGNKLNGTIPATFQSLESMTSLNLSSNNLQGSIPIELSRIGNLDTLDISNNNIIGPIPSSLGDLEHLLKLNLSRNNLTGPIPAEFGNLKSVMDMVSISFFTSQFSSIMNVRKGSTVWVPDKELAWIPAEVIDSDDKFVQIVTGSGKKVFVSAEKLCPRDADEDELGGFEDMTRLTYLNEPGVLYNIRRRYALNDIYTYTGSILIAVNPFTKLPHLYDSHMMEQYKGAPLGELSPHVFAVADASYRAMMNEGKSQSILVSGESGAGKTETTKLIMQYLTFVGGRTGGDDRTVEQQVLESNPLLEAFGNARTVRNDNSSRFGKFVEIQFDRNGRISGAAIRTYLLERSRVVQIKDPERNYHCFYQLCASERDAEEYKLGHPSHFHYLNQSKIYELNGVSNAEEYMRTRRAMDIVGISHGDQEAIFRVLAAILHLGNVEFSPGKEHDSSAIKDEKSRFHMQMAADLFMCDVDLLLATLCTRSIQTREGNIIKALDCNAAVAGRDALAKTVYARLFDWLVDKINRSVGQDINSPMQIGVLDIYGFECFKDNSFEQFCINFANEKLQQHFNEHVFKMEQEEYGKEEINWSYIEFVDNQDVLDLIEKKPIGVIALLDEACMFPKSTHETFSTKLFQHFRSHPRLQKEKFSQTDFIVSHYAGKVTYHTDTFLDKNRDYVVVEHCNLFSSSNCPFVSGLFPSLPEESSRSSYKFSSVATRFKQQLQSLMETLKSTEPHYIRCVKPNSLNRPQMFENASIIHQLRCGGVLEAIRISLAGYPTRRTYSEFVDRYGLIGPEILDGSYYDDKAATEKILHKLKLDNFQLGRTKVFLRAGQIGVLDSKRTEVLDNAAKCIQCQLRTFITRRHFISVRAAAVSLQACCRGYIAQKMYAAKRETAAAITVQKYIRMWLTRHAHMKLYSSAIIIQSHVRGFITQQRFLHGKEHRAATSIQACWRMYKVRSAFQRYLASVVAIQCLWRCRQAKREFRRLKQEANEAGALRLAKTKLEKQMEELTWRLHLEKKIRVSNEEAKQRENSALRKMLEAVNLELDAAKLATINECNKNAVLQNQLELSAKEKSALKRELVSVDELRKENAMLKFALDSFEKKYTSLELEYINAQKGQDETIEKLRGFEEKCSQLEQNVKSLEEKLLSLEDENHVLRQKALSAPRKSNRPSFAKSFSEKYSTPIASRTERKPIFETPTPTKTTATFTPGMSDSHRSKPTAERNQDNYEFLSRCIKENLGFKNGKPIAARIIYKCLLHWHAFESERTAIFDNVIEGINDALKVREDDIVLPYWLSNTSALLCLLQRNLRSNGFLATNGQRYTGSSGLTSRTGHGPKSPLKFIGYDDGMSHVEARYPAILFKQQLTACVEKIFGLLRDNLKKELSPLLQLCIQTPKTGRTHGGKSSRSPVGLSQQSSGSQWSNIVKFLDSLMSKLRGNHVPSFFIRKLVTQVFHFINITLFNSLLLRRECCTFSNGEYMKSGLSELEKWIANAKEMYAGTSWHELNYIRQAVGFLVIHQKRKKSLEEIRQDLCPALTVRQIYRISTMYWDDKYGTQSVSNEVVSVMREIVNKDNQNMPSNSFLLDDDLSIPFSAEDVDKAIPPIDLDEIDLPVFVSEYSCAQFLNPHQNRLVVTEA